MQTFNQALYKLVKAKVITEQEAMAKATGLGLALEVRQLIFTEELEGQWHLHEQDEGEAHRLALIAELKNGAPEIVTHRIASAELIEEGV